MKSRKWLLAIVLASVAASARPIVATDRLERRKPAYEVTDAATGAKIRVFRTNGLISLEVDHPTVQIRKQLIDGQTTTTMRVEGEEIAITVAREAVTVTGAKGRIQATRLHPERVRPLQVMLAASPAAARASELIGRMQLTADSPLRQTLLSTRAFLLASAGDDSAVSEISRSIRQLELARRGGGYIRTAGQDMTGPGVCWTLYAVEAIAAYIEYEGCMNGEEWWDILGQISCAVIYDIRAIGAFAWWLSCVGLNT